MFLKDRLTRGFIAGVIAGIVMNIISFAFSYFDLTTLNFVEWAGIVIYGNVPPFIFAEMIWAFIAQIFFAGGLGIVFIYLVPQVTSKNLLFKGWFYGGMVWFILYGISMLYEVTGTTPLPLKTSVSDFVGASIYGVILAEVSKRMLKKFELTS